jgi:cytochrome c oxidase cbb3-type subunit 3
MNADIRTRIAEAELDAINPDDNPDLYNYAVQGGAATYRDLVLAVPRLGRGRCRPRAIRTCWTTTGSGAARSRTSHLPISHGIRNEETLELPLVADAGLWASS